MTSEEQERELIERIRGALKARWPLLPVIGWKPMPSDTKAAIKAALAARYPDIRFSVKVRQASKRKGPGGFDATLAWTAYPGAPEISDLEDLLAPVSYWRSGRAEKVMQEEGIVVGSVILNAVLRDTWGIRCGLNCRPEEPTLDEMARWKRKQLRQEVVKAANTRTKSKKRAM
jgi:hypothetical protein